MMFVIGSGPAGAACAHALLHKGEQVTMLDVGVELEPNVAEKVRQLRIKEPEHWDHKLLEEIKSATKPKTSGIPVKYLFGSDYPYKFAEKLTPLELHNAFSTVSLAKGGLSTVWGSAALPYTQDDISDWPISIRDLAPYYEYVFSFLPLSGADDLLSERFPLYTKPFDLQSSVQAKHLLAQMAKNTEKLKKGGIYFGKSRVAVKNSDNENCRYCGMCNYGCPYNLIYNAAFTVEELQKNKRFTYNSGYYVQTVREEKGKVTITAVTLDGTQERFTAEKAFVAAGVINTAKILIQSGIIDNHVTVQDTQYFILPILQHRGAPAVVKERLHTLPQIFLELFDENISKHSLHMQLYTYNDLYGRALKGKFGKIYGLIQAPANLMLGRTSVIIGLLHSQDSPTLSMELKEGKVILTKQDHPQSLAIIKATVQKLRRHGKQLGFLPLTPMLEIGTTGKSYHYGGTLPMSTKASRGQSDVLGRPHGCSRIHIVDGSVLPTVPANTITLTIMANAARIADQHDS
jgi:choline dehydrogenase-like flavoprotein